MTLEKMDSLLNSLANLNLEASNPFSVLWFLFTHGGFILVIYAFLLGFSLIWKNWRQAKFDTNLEHVFLAIDVPKDNEQSIKAVEQIFNHLWGAIKGPDFKDLWWTGYSQPSFSLEIVSLEGYIQYIVRTPKMFRDLVEAAVYAQYPGAQITQIKDYTEGVTPQNFKEQGYNLWGSQFGLVQNDVYPIRTYPLFEHVAEKTRVDPTAALFEIFSRMGAGEQTWFQIVIKPISDDWKKRSADEVKKITGTYKPPQSTDLVGKILEKSNTLITQTADSIFTAANTSVDKKEAKEPEFKMMNLSPGERSTVEGIERKAEKTGFMCKMRYIYLVRNTKLVKTKGASGFVGFLKQFALLNSNGFKPVSRTKTGAEWYQTLIKGHENLVVTGQQKRILRNYKARSMWLGGDKSGFILNTEELATLYHFPHKDVVAPTVKTTQIKHREAPMTLPTENNFLESEKEKLITARFQTKTTSKFEEKENGTKAYAPPPNLPL